MTNIIIVAQAKNRVIGIKNKMPWHLPADLAFFKKQTLHHPVIMGRNTYNSLGKALPQRDNIVISSRGNDFKDARVCANLQLGLQYAETISNKIFIIGGAQLYRAAMPYADILQITWIDAYIKGDTYFPIIDDNYWQQRENIFFAKDENNIFNMNFVSYYRK